MDYIATVAIFFYNHTQYALQTIESIIAQQSKYRFIVYLVDDCSTDNTQEIIENYCNNYRGDNLVKIFNKINKGLNENYEDVIKTIETKYFFALGGDDYWIDNKKLEKEIDILENNPSLSYIHTGFQKLIEPDNVFGEVYDKWNWKQKKTLKEKVVSTFVNDWSFYPLASTGCIRTSVIKFGLDNYKQLLHSYVVGEGTFTNVSVCMSGGEYYFIPDVTTIYRVRQNSLSHYQDKRKSFEYFTNFFREKIEALNLIDVEYRKEYYFQWYCLSYLLKSAIELNCQDYFDSLLNESLVSETFKKYFLFLNKNFYLSKLNIFALRLYIKLFRK